MAKISLKIAAALVSMTLVSISFNFILFQQNIELKQSTEVRNVQNLSGNLTVAIQNNNQLIKESTEARKESYAMKNENGNLTKEVKGLKDENAKLKKQLETFMIKVSGTAKTSAPGTVPTMIVFEKPGARFYAPILADFRFETQLPNHDDYQVKIVWDRVITVPQIGSSRIPGGESGANPGNQQIDSDVPISGLTFSA